jgi:glycosyltransferase involved in cell wall biosynthesis
MSVDSTDHGAVDYNKFLSSASFRTPERLVNSAWLQHGPFGFWLVEAMRPNRIVELGTHNGFSYGVFCQQVKTMGISTQCAAVDTWQGDEHAGKYTDEVYRNFQSYHEPRYAGFSRLIRARFDQAASEFAQGSIDLLHVDGRHFYEDAKEDFEGWEGKLSERAVVLFHDTRVKDRGFGVWKLWEELTKRYPSFEFHHGFGLGVLSYGPAIPSIMREFFASNDHQSWAIREAYSYLGQSIEAQFRVPSTNVTRPVAPSANEKAAFGAQQPLHIHLAVLAPDFMDVRTYLPLRELAKQTGITTSTSEKRIQVPQLRPADRKIAIIQRISIKDTLQWVNAVRTLTAQGWLLVSEIDDHPDLMARVHQTTATKRGAWDPARLMHAVQTSTESLAAEIRPHNAEVAVFENTVLDVRPRFQQPASGRVRIFFGALNREHFSSIVGAALASFGAANPQVEFVVVHDKAFFDSLGPANKSFRSWLTYDQYLQLLGSCDVALMPLEGVGGEQFKSDLKFLEASSRGVVSIASPAVYASTIKNGETGIIAGSPGEWATAVSRLSADPDLRFRLASAAQEYVVSKRLFADQVRRRLDWYRHLWNQRHLLTRQLAERIQQGLANE